MLIAHAFHPGDYKRSVDFFNWCAELEEPNLKHRCLLIASSLCTREMMDEVTVASKNIFPSTTLIKQNQTVEGKWPIPQNALFRVTAEWVETIGKTPFMWTESDAAPLRPGWLDAIEQAYSRSGKSFLGCIYPWVNATDVQLPHLNANCVYPPFIKRYNPMMLQASDIPWDVFRSDLTMRHAAGTSLICNDVGNRQTGEACTFPTVESLARIPNDAVYFHRCKDGTLISRLREVRNPTASEPPEKRRPKHITLVAQVRHKVHELINGAATFMHSGNIGDVIYGLFAIKEYGGGDLIICPDQLRSTAPCLVPINKDQFELLLPLLREQSYLRNVEFSEKYPSRHVLDMNNFRNAWIDARLKNDEKLTTLCKTQFYDLGIVHKFREDVSWLTIPDPIESGKIVIHRSPRYNSHDFPWPRLVAERRKDLLFVGLPHEHAKFQEDFKCQVSFWGIKDFLEMARLIAGARAFVGNQSAPLSIALGSGQNIVCEAIARSPDCRFKRNTYVDQLMVGPDKLDFTKL